MKDLDNLMKMLEDGEGYEITRGDTVRRQAEKEFREKLFKVGRRCWLWLLAMVCLMAVAVTVLLNVTSVKAMLVAGVVVIVTAQQMVLIKLWYWICNSRLNVGREIKELQLLIAQLAVNHERPEAADNKDEGNPA